MTLTRITEILKRNARLAVLIGIAVVLVILMFIFYSGSRPLADEKAKLEVQQRAAAVALSNAQAQYDVTKLQAEKDSLQANIPSFPSALPSVGLSAYIGAAADKYGVEILSLTPRGASSEALAASRYTRYDIAVTVSGEYDKMNSFLSYLEGGPFLSLRIEGGGFTPNSGALTVVILTQS